MRSRLVVVWFILVGACHGGNDSNDAHCIDPSNPQCVKPQCSDGIDNDGDGLIDYPNDPGCASPNEDSEVDDCPDGPNCPQCGNHIDDDNNGLIDFSGGDPGCMSAADPIEYTENPAACGSALLLQQMPDSGMVSAMFDPSSTTMVVSPCGGGGVNNVVAMGYELHLAHPQVVTISTEGSAINTVVDLRKVSCPSADSEIACNDDISSTDMSSSVTAALDAGTYFILVESRNGDVGAFMLTVQEFAGAGTACQTNTDCGPGLVCRIPQGSSAMVCSKHECQDGVDNDGDGLIDYPNDPGCASPDGDDETDDCPSGPNCPECANHIDDNNNGKTDYPAETNCVAASSTTEWCLRHSPVAKATAPMTMGDTTGLVNDYNSTCASETNSPDLTYRLDVPALDTFHADVNSGSWFADLAMLDHTCVGTEVACSSELDLTNLAAGTYFLVVDGDSPTDFGPFTLDISGSIKAGASCESALAVSGALTCGAGYACKGTAGSRTCLHTQCSDGLDNNGDGKIDYPNDPGCSSPNDDTETTVCPGVNCPVCSNMVDDNSNGLTDWPAEWGCDAASGDSEKFCTGDSNPSTKITTKTTTGTTVGKIYDDTLLPSCQADTMSPELAFGLELPVPVASLQVDTIGSTFDTVLAIRDANCAAEIPNGCDDDDGGNLTSEIVLTNVSGGGYAVIVDGYDASSGAFTLNVRGTVASGTACSSPLFSGGAQAVLVCPAGTTCGGSPATCH